LEMRICEGINNEIPVISRNKMIKLNKASLIIRTTIYF